MKLFIWVLLTGPLHPPLNIAEKFGGAFRTQAGCEHTIVELLRQHPELPSSYYRCQQAEVIDKP